MKGVPHQHFPSEQEHLCAFLVSCLLPIDPVIITHGETFIIYQRYLDYLQLCIRIHQDKFMITQISITLLIHPTYIGQDIPMKISKNLTMWA